jgi:DNA polymerase I-like protein with 3'-5' exonuclease and polymerase domains
VLAFDTETDLIREARLAPDLACLTSSDGQSADILHHTDPQLYYRAIWLLQQETTTANAPYDLSVLWAAYPDLRDLIWDTIEKGRVHDVIIRQKLMDLGEGVYRQVFRRLVGEEKTRPLHYNLSDIHARYYGSTLEKDEHRLKYGEYRLYPLSQWPEGAIKYAMTDALVTARIHDQQTEYARTHPKNNLWDEAAQVRANWALTLMSCWGFATDKKQVEKVIAQIDAEMPALIARLSASGLVRKEKGVFKRSAKLAKKLMYAAVGDAGELTDTGYAKVKAGEMSKDEALRAGYIKIDEEWCEISNYPGLIDYYQYGQNQLLRTKLCNIRSAAMYSLPVQTQFETLMETGRTSSSENKLISNSMALQNPPRKGGFRSCFTARPVCTLIAADYGQAELVSLAQVTYALCGYSKMRDLLNEGMDLHIDFAREIVKDEKKLTLTYDEAYKLYKAKDEYMRDRRTLAKGFNFGKPGGLGAASFQSYVRKAWGVEISFEQSKRYGVAWLDHFSEMREYMKWIGGLMERGKNNRADIQQFMSGRWRGKCYFTQGCNTLFQGLTADAAKAAMFEVSKACYTVRSSPLYGCRPLLFVHDELIVEAPREQAAEAAKELERIMVAVYQTFTPDVRITADAHLMNSWSKDAEATYDERGKLVPWNPPQDADEKMEVV